MTSPAERPRIVRHSRLALIIAGAAGVGLALWLSFGPDKGPAPPRDPISRPHSNDPREAVRAELPEELARPPDAVTPNTRALAASLPTPPSELAGAIARARADGILPARRFPASALGAPRTAGELADALMRKAPAPACSFELATLLGGLLRSRGATVEYARIPGARFDATELLARRFAVRIKNGPWLAPDGGPVDGVTPLSDLDTLGHAVAYRALGALAANDVDTASRAAGYARRLLPDDPAVAFVVAEVQALNGLPDEARRTYDRAAQVAADAMTWYRLGRVARAEGRPFKADEYFKEAIALDAGFAAPHVGLAELTLERLDVTPKGEHAALIEAAERAIEAADQAEPGAAGIRIVKAHLAALAGDNDKSRALLEEEVEHHPEEEMSFVMLANVYAAEERDADALATLEAARAKGHETADVLDGLGTLYAMQSRFKDASEAYARALEIEPDHPAFRLQLAQMERELGHLGRVRELLAEQKKRFPRDETAGLLLAQLELAEGQPDKARLEVSRVLDKNPHSKEAILLDYFIGAATAKVEAQARQRAQEAVGTRRMLAEMLLENGLIEEAEVNLNAALNEEPDDLVAPVLLVAIYMATHRESEANALRESTLDRLDPSQRGEVQKLFEDAVGQALRAQEPEPINP